MAQIFASERSTIQAQAPAKKQETRDTAPENALAGLQQRADASGPTARLTQMQNMERAPAQRMEEDELQGKFEGDAVQRMEEDELQGKFIADPIQRMEEDELQGKFTDHPVQRIDEEEELMQGKAKDGGMPTGLKAGIETLSGASMNDVSVHYNSSKPAAVQAHAYAQGSDIHLASGQEKHLPHEAWHVAQQKQGRVQATTEVGGMPVNDNPGLEAEADAMGAKAAQMFGKDGDR